MADATRLDGRVALITGGAGGIGSATARLMAERGAQLVIADIATEPARRLAASLPSAIAVTVDLGDESSVVAMVRTALEHYGRLDILHNNAAALDPDAARNITGHVLVCDGGFASHVAGIDSFRRFFEVSA